MDLEQIKEDVEAWLYDPLQCENQERTARLYDVREAMRKLIIQINEALKEEKHVTEE